MFRAKTWPFAWQNAVEAAKKESKSSIAPLAGFGSWKGKNGRSRLADSIQALAMLRRSPEDNIPTSITTTARTERATRAHPELSVNTLAQSRRSQISTVGGNTIGTKRVTKGAGDALHKPAQAMTILSNQHENVKSLSGS
ncbi:hypothetical protein CPLU01_04605 [Colletotrichum plurivorum]|uniref:Uncharacterized protein n=1 Tax=Colletotrichum plurivorum TaxID=2175906 RepID=A0A8H6KPD0_9PEZI|nr:hypothetical protein CPLU01_04605 [Colletotrichum plurivorum]